MSHRNIGKKRVVSDIRLNTATFVSTVKATILQYSEIQAHWVSTTAQHCIPATTVKRRSHKTRTITGCIWNTLSPVLSGFLTSLAFMELWLWSLMNAYATRCRNASTQRSCVRWAWVRTHQTFLFVQLHNGMEGREPSRQVSEYFWYALYIYLAATHQHIQ